MAANWPTFVSSLTTYLVGLGAQSEAQTANTIAGLYATAISSATVIASSAPLARPANTSAIAAGFLTSFNNAKLIKKGKTRPDTWMPAANAIIADWGTMSISPMPAVLPATLPSPGYTITNPGNPNKIARGINNAFKSGNAATVASILAATFTQHLTTIQGSYYGLWPNPSVATTGVPITPYPWVAPATGPPAPISWKGLA